MLRSALGKVMWVGRATVFMVGLAVVFAVVLGLASAALAGTGVGATFNLGKTNTVNRLSQLVGSTDNPMLRVNNKSAGADATALTLQVQPGHAPMRVNSGTRVANLNSDKLDGKDASQIGVNGLERVAATSASNSASPKQQSLECPPGKVLLGSGYDLSGGKTGTDPNAYSDLVVDLVLPATNSNGETTGVLVGAYEIAPTTDTWDITVYGICAAGP